MSEYEVFIRSRGHDHPVIGILVETEQDELRYPPDLARFFREMADRQDETLYTREDR